MKRSGRARTSSGPPGAGERSRHGRASRGRARRQRAEQVDQRTEPQRLVDTGRVEWGGELIWAVGFTSGGAPFGLRASEFDPADLQAMGLDVTVVDDGGLASGEWLDGCDAGLAEVDFE